MPKLFSVHIQVEEVALGRIMRLLNQTPGVAKFDLELAHKANGHAKPAHASKGVPRKTYEVTGRDFMAKIFAKTKRPLKLADLRNAFDKDGRSPKSIASVVHRLKNEGLVEARNGEGYMATKKLRDRARRAAS